MKIDEMKNIFISLLRARLDAGEEEEIYLSGNVLEENGLSGNTFWEVICPVLKKEKLLKHYNNPDDILSDFFLSKITFTDEDSRIRLLKLRESIDCILKTKDHIREVEGLLKRENIQLSSQFLNSGELDDLRKEYRHRFLVDKKKVLQASRLSSPSSKIVVHLDQKMGIYRLINKRPIRYPHVTSKSKIFSTLLYLLNNDSATLQDLASHTGQEKKTIKRDIKGFNKASRSRLQLLVDPIIGDGVYKLNRDYIDFV